ncbi:unnamed protein product [Symbiodinium necroappetens]|uniref:Uncharacterized protein n=1 Tax=Symbiodinium necroappetens TaxID=1628268 RepID=A0A812QCI4_9DINO|nr:unnamed protein product [Symbiodinium necroappetens]
MNMPSCCNESLSNSLNISIMLLSPFFFRWSLEVIRRTSYKGATQKCKFKTPVDCATIPGMILCLSSVLQNRGLTNTSVQKVWKVFETFDKQSSMNQMLALLPDLHVEAKENMVRIEDWHAALQRLGFGALVELTTRYFGNDKNFITVGKCLFLLLAARQRPTIRDSPLAQTVTMRLLHQFCQHVEVRLERDGSPLLSSCPHPTKCSTYHPYLKHSRSQGHPALKDKFLARFGAKSGGFATSKDELSLHELGIVSSKSRIAQRACSEWLIRYMAKASQAMADDVKSQCDLKTLNFCLDAARVCKQQVLTFQFRVGECSQAALLQILPDTAPCRDAETTLKALDMALEGGLPTKSKKLVNTARHLVTHRQSAKQILHSIKNAIGVYMQGFSFADTVPSQLLRPRGETCKRLELTKDEKQLLSFPENRRRFFLFNTESGEVSLDCQAPMAVGGSPPLTLCWAADEGTDLFVAFQYVAKQGCFCMFWPDLFHKIHRKQAGAIASCSESRLLLSKLTKLFRSSRAPWDSAKFGKQRLETRLRLIQELENRDASSNALDACCCGMARDLGIPVSEMSPRRALQELKKCAGTWSLRLLESLFGWWEQGINPYDLLGSSSALESADDEKGQQSYSIRALYWEVLSDSTNQAIGLASGETVRGLIRKTIADCTSPKALIYCNCAHAAVDETAQEVLTFLYDCLVRSVLCLEKRHWPGVLEHMREEWKFILFLDGFSSTSQARRLFTFTEMQCFRELFTEAESIDFDASHVDSERVRALAARLAGSDTKALLSSLPNELMFNDLRDAQRRHAKHEMAKLVHLAAVSIRSSGHRSPLHAVEVDNADWNSHDQAKVLRSNILQAARERDKNLGVPLQELICEKNLSYVTKPHIYCQRLRLFQNLKRKFFAGDGHAIDMDKILREVWPSNTLTPGCLWQQESFNNEAVVVVLSGGPHAVRYMQLKLVEVPGYDELYGFDDGKLQVHETLDFHMCFGKLSMPQPVASEEHGLLVRPLEWYSPGEFMCRHTISQVRAGVLTEYGNTLKLNLAKVNQRSRVEQIMRHHQMPEEPDDDAAGDVSDDEAEEAELYEAMNYNIEEDDDADAAQEGGEPDAGQQDSRPPDDTRAPQHDEQPASADVPMGHAVPDDRQERRDGGTHDRKEPHRYDLPQHKLVKILPDGLKYGNKRSRAFSFVPAAANPYSRGVTRSFQQACLAATTWSFQWFNALPEEKQLQVREKFPPVSLPQETGENKREAEEEPASSSAKAEGRLKAD